jgi:DNA-binding CsgD family transcriptional regulator
MLVRMRLDEVKKLVAGTSDAAFAVDGEGVIVAWNQAAETLLNIPAEEAVGAPCAKVIEGTDECGPVCSELCTVRQAVEQRRPVGNFDLQIGGRNGRQWCNISVLQAEDSSVNTPYAIHVIRTIDFRKRLEILVRDFVVTNTNVPREEAVGLISSTRSPAQGAELTNRELEILRIMAKGGSTSSVASTLHISRATVNNHIQHILRKLNSHTRLEAIRRAEHGGLL